MINSRARDLKKRLRAGEVTLGTWLGIANTSVAEIVAGVGFDWALIDTEHGVFGNESLQSVLMAFSGSKTVPIVRVPSNDPVPIKQVLDMGADGIMIPMVNSVEGARAAVAACKYPPVGTRGAGPLRAADYGRKTNEYFAQANDSVIVMPQIEHIDAARDIERILEVPGIDIVCLGPTDMSGTAGVLRQFDHPIMVKAIEAVLKAAKTRKLPACLGIDLSDSETRRMIKLGATMVLAGDDVGSLCTGLANSLEHMRAVTGTGSSRKTSSKTKSRPKAPSSR
ncbi:MAG TPA: aldolase/citrate lyase family protein [Bauldia sp.]|nr:aldolase/citrate lyase family protein [Bauldia sp.]